MRLLRRFSYPLTLTYIAVVVTALLLFEVLR